MARRIRCRGRGRPVLEWQVAGFGVFTGSGTSDMLLRDTQTGTFEVFDNNAGQLALVSTLGQVGLEWQVGGIAPDPLPILAQ